ncbi:MAG: glycosyltransferase family 4 protein [Chloroflexi bacterium]|nr:MAG: glycosyltransferase family 4 protein [Chloroflexota bacterium]
MSDAAALMLVSARVDLRLRGEVADGLRPCPEYLELERHHGIELLDWSRLPGDVGGRSSRLSLLHVAVALLRRPGREVIFSDGEHLAIPLGLALRSLGGGPRHLALGHHLTSRIKPFLLRGLRGAGIDRLLVHSRTQQAIATRRLGLDPRRVAFLPYYADASFWRPGAASAGENLVLAVGREHRDYTTFATAVEGLPLHVQIAAGSLHSPGAVCRLPRSFPPNVQVGMLGLGELRHRYAAATVVVVPLLSNDFQAGITTILEAMAMGKAVVVTATEGQRDVVVHGETGLLVPPGDPEALKDALRGLIANPRQRRRLGENAREAVLRNYDLPIYAARLAAHISDLGQVGRAVA